MLHYDVTTESFSHRLLMPEILEIASKYFGYFDIFYWYILKQTRKPWYSKTLASSLFMRDCRQLWSAFSRHIHLLKKVNGRWNARSRIISRELRGEYSQRARHADFLYFDITATHAAAETSSFQYSMIKPLYIHDDAQNSWFQGQSQPFLSWHYHGFRSK